MLRYLITRAIKPVKARRDAAAVDETDDADTEIPLSPSDEDEDDEIASERIDESESEAAPAAID